MTYTGKAASVLVKYHNLKATTIHSKIYTLVTVPDSVFKELYKERDAAEGKEKEKIIKQIEELLAPQFTLNVEAFCAEDRKESVLVLDECSMVDDEVLDDLTSFGIPIIALGDPGQLPPIGGEGALFKGISDAKLTEIHRQALGSPIIQWSMRCRKQQPLPSTDWKTWRKEVCSKFPKTFLTPSFAQELMDYHEIAICWKNITRQNLNQERRTHLGHTEINPIYPVVGEQLIITKNDRDLGLYNGQFCKVIELGKEYPNFIETLVETEEHDDPVKLRLHKSTFELYHNPNAKDNYKACS
jgi:exodeoxyribonuclease-5